MRLRCIYGYFIFEETKVGQISDFMSRFGLEIASDGDHYTFQDLVEAPTYSLAGGTFLGCPTTETFEGRPWEVMRANGLVYNFATGLVVPIETITQIAEIKTSANYFLTTGMILPGSITEDGSRVTDYAAFYNSSELNFKYSEVDYE